MAVRGALNGCASFPTHTVARSSNRSFRCTVFGSDLVVHQPEQCIHVDRLRQVPLDPEVEHLPDPARRSVCTHHDYLCVGQLRHGLESVQQFVTGDVGQVEVEKNQVRPMLAGQLEPRTSFAG